MGSTQPMKKGRALGGLAAMALIGLGITAGSAHGANGAFELTWGKDVAAAGPGNTGTGLEVCVAANGDTCKAGVAGALGGEMDGPGGLATDGAGNFYVAEYFSYRVQKFDSAGTFLRAWGKDVASAGPGNTGTGFEICVAANGDTCKVGVSGGLGGEMSGPADIAVDGAGSIYVTDALNHRIQKFDSDGTFLRAWGRDVASAGPGNTGTAFEICVAASGDTCQAGIFGALGGEMRNPTGIGTDGSGNVLVTESQNERIQKFDSGGNFMRGWGRDVVSAGPGNTGTAFEICIAGNGDTCKVGVSAGSGGAMSTPGDVATDAAGNVYLGDVSNHRIQKFDSAGNFLRAWGRDVAILGPGNTGTGYEICVAANGDTCKAGVAGGLAGEVSAPGDIAADAAGNVYVADFFHRVQTWGTSGNFLRAWGKDVASAGPGNTGTGFEVCVPASGDTCKAGVAGALGGEMNVPQGLAINGSGKLHVADNFNNRIQRFGDLPVPPGGGGGPAGAPGGGTPPAAAPATTCKKKKKKKGKRASAAAKCKKKKKKKKK